MTVSKRMLGYEMEKMSNLAFRVMSVFIRLHHAIVPVSKRIDTFGIRNGSTVIDFGCGPGSYLARASELVGASGKVFAVDVHELAIASAQREMERKNLGNVIPVLVKRYPVDLDESTADLIYALDMFHMVKDPPSFLGELHRLIKPDGILVIESGHQPPAEAREKIVRSGLWDVVEQKGKMFRCSALAKPSPAVATASEQH